MMEILSVSHLTKVYPQFTLSDVSFTLEAGRIMGLIGRNGAGKTTTLKSLLHLVHPTSGEIRFFGETITKAEEKIKQQIGYAVGGTHYYPRATVGTLAAMTAKFYSNWDDQLYQMYLKRFSLSESKRLRELSEGMKVKFYLTLALSHHAKLLLLDEPTSGLDPVSRDELLEIFLELAKNGTAILFSTHITSDLEKCADDITYLRKGKVAESNSMAQLLGKYRLCYLDEAQKFPATLLHGISHSKQGDTGLLLTQDAAKFSHAQLQIPSLQDLMVHLDKEDSEK